MIPIKQYSSYNELSLETADFIYRKIKRRITDTGAFNLGLATGNSPKGTYAELIKLLRESKLDLSQLHTFNLDEYYPIASSDKNCFYQEMVREFWEPLHRANNTFNIANGHIPNGETKDGDTECQKYEILIKEHGGIDLQILGLGPNGHIGFNEPGSAGDSRTRKITITPESKKALKKTYGKNVPDFGLTMGIGTILEASEIILIVTGESKKEIFQELMTLKKPTPEIPASFLIIHPNTTIYSTL